MSNWSLAIVALTLLGYAAVSRRLDRTIVTGPMVFVGVGLAVGAAGTDWLHPSVRSSVIRTMVEAALTLVLFADASRIDLGALRKEFAVPARLLGIGLPLTIAAGTLVALGLLPALSLRRGARARDRARADRRGARPGGGHRPSPAVADPPGPQRRERPERRPVRATSLHRARDRRDAGRSAQRAGVAAARARGDRLGHHRRCRGRRAVGRARRPARRAARSSSSRRGCRWSRLRRRCSPTGSPTASAAAASSPRSSAG